MSDAGARPAPVPRNADEADGPAAASIRFGFL